MQFAKVVTSVFRILGLLQALACGKAALLLCAIPQSCGIDRGAPGGPGSANSAARAFCHKQPFSVKYSAWFAGFKLCLTPALIMRVFALLR